MKIRPVTQDDWSAIERLFGERGACAGCWCMWWRVPRGGRLWKESQGEPNRRALRSLVRAGEVHAMLALEGDEPVGWCCFGPRRDFPRLETVRALRREGGDGTWAITCFYVPARQRGKGVARALLAAATRRAFKLGAREVEGYPAVPRETKHPGAFAWSGVPALFEGEGYVETGLGSDARRLVLKRRRG